MAVPQALSLVHCPTRKETVIWSTKNYLPSPPGLGVNPTLSEQESLRLQTSTLKHTAAW